MSQMTKIAIANTLKSLMKQSSLDKITVVDVTTKCGVNRQTFYYHFKDIYDLVDWIYTTEALESIDSFKTYETWQEGYLKIFEYVNENKEFCLNCLKSSGREYLENHLYRMTYQLLIDVINEVVDKYKRTEFRTLNMSEQTKTFIANFYCYGFIGIMTTWIRNGFLEDPKEIVNDLNMLIEGDIQKAIEKYRL